MSNLSIQRGQKGGCYDTAKRQHLIDHFSTWCSRENLGFSTHESLIPPDETTLFTTSGMQKHKSKFKDKNLTRLSIGDVQRCLRLTDLSEIGDGTHFLDFTMLGLFSFRHMSLMEGTRFWLGFLNSVGVLPDTVTIHPECQHHRYVYKDIDVRIVESEDNVWSDGDIGGYCTEFFKNGVELGNIVIPLGDSLDCGFGLERIGSFIDGYVERDSSRRGVLLSAINSLRMSGVTPTPNGRGYVLRKLVRICVREGIPLPEDDSFSKEIQRVNELQYKLPRLLQKHKGRSRSFFKETFGLDDEDLPVELT